MTQGDERQLRLAWGLSVAAACGLGWLLGAAGGEPASLPASACGAPAEVDAAPLTPPGARTALAGSTRAPERLAHPVAAHAEEPHAPVTAAHTDPHDAEGSAEAARRRVAELRADLRARDQALAEFRTPGNAERAAALAPLLAKLADPAVEEAALAVLAQEVDPAHRAAAFDVLEGLDSPRALQPALEVLATEADALLRRAALGALGTPAGTEAAAAPPVVSALTLALSTDPDPELRRRAAISLGRWHRSVADLAPVLRALERDPSADVRAGAAFSVEVSGARSPAVAAALAAALERTDEAQLVRENAWRALQAQGSLAPDVARAYRDYAAEREARREASGP